MRASCCAGGICTHGFDPARRAQISFPGFQPPVRHSLSPECILSAWSSRRRSRRRTPSLHEGSHWRTRSARLGGPIIPTVSYLGFPQPVHQAFGTTCPLFQRIDCPAWNGPILETSAGRVAFLALYLHFTLIFISPYIAYLTSVASVLRIFGQPHPQVRLAFGSQLHRLRRTFWPSTISRKLGLGATAESARVLPVRPEARAGVRLSSAARSRHS